MIPGKCWEAQRINILIFIMFPEESRGQKDININIGKDLHKNFSTIPLIGLENRKHPSKLRVIKRRYNYERRIYCDYNLPFNKRQEKDHNVLFLSGETTSTVF